jgi:hypothetical protein
MDYPHPLKLYEKNNKNYIANNWLGITNPISRNNIGPVLAHETWGKYGAYSLEWAITKPAEVLTISTYKFSQDLQFYDFNTAISQFLSNLNLNGLNSINNQKAALLSDAVAGAFSTKIFTGLDMVMNLFNGDNVSITDIHNTIFDAVKTGQDIIASNETYRQDFDNTLNALTAMDTQTQQQNIYIQSDSDNANKNELVPTFENNLNGTNLNSVGARVVSLLVTLDSLEEALNLYEQYKP